jgi:3-oxoacyl-[acyl-carrier protein] reductase
MHLGIKNKTVLITGASKNIGKSIAVAMAEEGCNVVICARDKIQLNNVISIISEYSGKHEAFCVDLENENGPSNLLDNLKKKNIFPDIIIHNLGGSLKITDPNFSRKDLENVWQFNIGIAHEINNKLIPNMIEKKWGRIVHISSLGAKTGKGYVPYVSAKCALEGYVKGMSKIICNKNVIMTAVAPGLVELPNRYFTKMKNEDPERLNNYFEEHLPIKKMAQPNEIADVICFLCSEKANHMPGVIVPIDGGGD